MLLLLLLLLLLLIIIIKVVVVVVVVVVVANSLYAAHITYHIHKIHNKIQKYIYERMRIRRMDSQISREHINCVHKFAILVLLFLGIMRSKRTVHCDCSLLALSRQ